MKKVICNNQELFPKKTLSIIFLASLVAGSLLPLTAVAEEAETNIIENGVDTNQSTEQSNPSQPVNSEQNIIAEVTSTENSGELMLDDDNKSPTAAADAYLDGEGTNNVGETQNARDISQNVEDPKNSQSQETEKKLSWMNLEYLLGGGLLLMLLGELLLLSSLFKLKKENKALASEQARLRGDYSPIVNRLKKAEQQQEMLTGEYESLKERLEQDISLTTNIDDMTSFSVAASEAVEMPVIEDLNDSDLTELSTAFENWIKTNRGSTKVDGFIPEAIQKKIRGLHYNIELWSQSDGVDSIKKTESTKNASVISVIKDNGAGYAYCYTKPNSLSSLWFNKAWYEVKKVGNELEVLNQLQGIK